MKGETKVRTETAVLESRWYANKNTTVKGLFDVLADVHFNNPNHYFYEMFCDESSFRNAVARVAETRGLGIRYLYIAGHGDARGLVCPDGEIVSRTKVKNTLIELGRYSRLEGLYFGTCFFGEEDNLAFILVPELGPKPSIKWIAGYGKEVDWVDSSSLDLFFWNKLLVASRARLGPIDRVEWVAGQVVRCMDGLARELEFAIYKRKPGQKDVIELLSVFRSVTSTSVV